MKISYKTTIFFQIIILSASLSFFSCQKETSNKNDTSVTNEKKGPDDNYIMETNPNGLSKSQAIIKTAYGNIIFRFYPKLAPNTVSRVLQLIEDGFYDGLTFHRVIEGFIIQTGDPTKSGDGGSGMKLKAELSDIQHIKGTMAMARSLSDLDSADSQFYISLKTIPDLNNKYTIFGQVVDGINILDKIKLNDRILSVEFIK